VTPESTPAIDQPSAIDYFSIHAPNSHCTARI
jgi:hypothetical protein